MDFKDILKGVENVRDKLENFEPDPDIDYHFDQWNAGIKLTKINDKFYIIIRPEFPKNTEYMFEWLEVLSNFLLFAPPI